MTDETYVHLHNHSFYSLLDGLSSVKDMVQGAVDLGFKSLSINDHGTCAGLLNFQKECKSKNIKPILGMEAYITEDHSKQDDTSKTYHLNLIAKNKAGYKNLIYLSSFGYLKGFYRKPRIDFNILEKHSEGLIVSTACCIGEIPYLLWKNDKEKARQLAEKYKEVFKDDFYIEIMTHEYYNDKEQEEREKKLAVMLHDLAKEMNVKAICTTDFHYVRKEDWEAQDVLLSIQTIDNIKNPDRFTFNSKDFYMKPYEEMVRLYSYDMSLLKNTVEISEKVENDLITFNQDLLPSFKVPEGFKDEEAYLKELVKSGMKEKGLIDITAYRERIKYEMSVIVKCKYTKYFLVLWDIINFARINKIYVGLGRGSAVSSLALYVLGITKVDPLKYDLIFERFLNPDRISPPDVDVDFDYNRREEVYNYIVNKYGSEYCSQIGTYNKLKARAVIGRVAKALDIGNDWEETQKRKSNQSNDSKDKKEEISKKSLELAGIIAKQIPFDPQITIEKALKDNEKFRQSMQKYPKLLDCARHIEGTMSSAGVHPAGIIVCKDKVIDHIPLRLSKGVICSQYDGPEVESIGLLKFDLLALKTLTVIDKTVKMIKERHKLDLDIDNLIPNDKKVFSVFDKSDDKNKIDTKGIFQFESPGMTKLLEAIKVDTVEDLIVANALYRPGPLGAGMHNMYAEYKHRKREITYLHPKMGEVLKDTYGIFCFDGKQKVYTAQGPINIEDILRNDIYFYDEKDKKISIVKAKDATSFINGYKDVYEYRLNNGFSIRCTKNHMVRLFDGTYMSIEEVFKNKLNLPYIVPSRKYFRRKGLRPTDKECLKFYLLGFLIGDGDLHGSTPLACVGSSKSDAYKIKEVFENLYDGAYGYVSWKCRSWYVSMGFSYNKKKDGPHKSNPLTNYIRQLKLNVSWDQKRIPFGEILGCREKTLALLAGYMDSDGCISPSAACYTSGNEDLLDDVVFLLWRLGYRCYRNPNKLHIVECKEFLEEIRPFMVLKNKYNDKNIVSGYKNIKLDSKMASEFVVSKINGESERKFCENNNFNRSTLKRVLSKPNKLNYCYLRSLDTIASEKFLMKWCCLFIESRKRIGKRKVFDLSLNNINHNFYLPPGTIVHNCYQENLMKVCQVLAGFTGAQADTFRKVVGKKKPELIKKERLDELFIEGCVKNGISKDIATKIFDQMFYFAGYGFNKSHSASYALIAYQSAYLKYYYSLEFMCNLLSSETNNNDKDEKLNEYMRNCEKMGIRIFKPNIDHSGSEFRIDKVDGEEVIRCPLTILKGVGLKAVDNIVKNQPYKSLEDFLRKIDHRVVNVRVFKTLAENGCMTTVWKITPEKLIQQYEEIKKQIDKDDKTKKKREKEDKNYDGSLFDDCDNIVV
jgi:DNA polymerase-3 subunit alpha